MSTPTPASPNDYEYDYTRIPEIPMPRTLPVAERLTWAHKLERFRMVRTMVAGNVLRGFLRTIVTPSRRLPRYIGPWTKDAPPAVVRTWNDDHEFGRQRVAGYDPKVVELVTARDRVPREMDPSKASLLTALDGEDIDVAGLLEQKRLFVCDYACYLGLRTLPGRHLSAPLVLLAYKPDTAHCPRALVPLSIWLRSLDWQAGTAPRAGRDLFFPEDGGKWVIARHFAQVADALHGDVWTHLVQSHFAANPLVLTTKRRLSSSHRLRRIIEPHMQFTLWVNDSFLGRAAQGLYGALMPLDKQQLTLLIQRAWKAWDFRACGFREDLARRGLADPAVLPEYPYREDGLAFVDVIDRFAAEIVASGWESDSSVAGDVELQAWASELSAPPPSGGGLTSLGPIKTRAQLTDVLARILVHFGPGHAAVHTPALDFAAYAPNMASSTTRDFAAISDEASITDFLPGWGRLLQGFMLHYGISGLDWGQFVFSDAGLDSPQRVIANKFDVELATLDGAISKRDRERVLRTWMSYPYLRPSRVPNSIFA